MRITFEVSEELKKEIKVECALTGLTIRTFVIGLFMSYKELPEENKKLLRGKIVKNNP